MSEIKEEDIQFVKECIPKNNISIQEAIKLLSIYDELINNHQLTNDDIEIFTNGILPIGLGQPVPIISLFNIQKLLRTLALKMSIQYTTVCDKNGNALYNFVNE